MGIDITEEQRMINDNIRVWDCIHHIQKVSKEHISNDDIPVGVVFGKQVLLDQESLYKCFNLEGELLGKFNI